MYSAFILFCNTAAQQQCLSKKRYTCADKNMPTEKILDGSVLFLFNLNDKSLLGPFTSLSEGGEKLDAGAWAMDIEENSASENVKVTWEDLHQMKNAPEKLAFLRNPKSCKLTDTQTIRILSLLKDEPLYLYSKK